MSRNNEEQDLRAQVRALRVDLENLKRQRASSLNKRDLLDCRHLTKIQDGQTDVYDSSVGGWVPIDMPVSGGSGGVTKGFASPSGVLSFPASGNSHYEFVTTPVTIPVGATSALVISTIQVDPVVTAPNDAIFFRNAVDRAGVNADDATYGQYLVNDGSGWKQPGLTRATVLSVTPGQSTRFGCYVEGFIFGASDWYGTPFQLTTAYLIS